MRTNPQPRLILTHPRTTATCQDEARRLHAA
jgi:hypothetical protein